MNRYKVLLDANIISDILKNVLSFNISLFPKKYSIYLPTLTLAELNKNNLLLEKLVELSKSINIYITNPSAVILNQEIEFIKTGLPLNIELFSLTEFAIKDGKKIIDYFRSKEFRETIELLKESIKEGIDNIKKMISTNDYKTFNTFVESYVQTQLGLSKPQFFKELIDDNKIDQIYKNKSLVLQGHFIYAKYINKKISYELSDVFDGLIISTLPYANIYYSEKRNISILKDIRQKMDWFVNIGLYNYQDFKRYFC